MSWLGKKRRGSAGLEAMLALPVMLVLFGAVSQVLITSQSRVHLEQAAYAAARAGLAHKCPPFNLLSELTSHIRFIRQSECEDRRDELDRIALERATDAARWALIGAAPTTGAAAQRGCDQVPAAADLLTGGGMIMGRSQAAVNALCYVFEPDNVEVTLEWEQPTGLALLDVTEYPIRATVTFKYPISTPFRRFVSDDERSDGTHWKTGTATVVLL